MNIIDESALDKLERGIEDNLKNYIYYNTPWIQEIVEGLEKVDLIQDELLILSSDPSFDTENAIQLYENNKDLSTTLASSNHYWTTLAHTKFYKYMQTRWPTNEKAIPNFIKSRYFFKYTSRKSRARQGLTRLWWIAHITYNDSNKVDPYYYTKIATKDQELFNLIIETKHVAQNKKALFAMLDTFTDVFELQNKGEIGRFHKRNFYRDTMQQINLIGSVAIWDLLSQEQAKQKLMNFVIKYLEIENKEHMMINS